MHCLMIACHPKSFLSRLGLIVTEPLALETLAAAIDGMEDGRVTHRIYDPLIEGGRPEPVIRREKPDILFLSGYLTASHEILRLARAAKRIDPDLTVWVGGVQAEAAPETFYDPHVDAIFTGGALGAVRDLLTHHGQDFPSGYAQTAGIVHREGGFWRQTSPRTLQAGEIPLPDRTYFDHHRSKIRYMGRRGVALVKTTVGCPADCSFCGCRIQNGGRFIARDLTGVERELQALSTDEVWIVDDDFLVSRNRVLAWIEMLERLEVQGRHYRFIAYGRADGLLTMADLIPRLKALGFVEWIVGFESIEDQRLEELDKGTTAGVNDRVVALLKGEGLTLTALFMVSPEDGVTTFRRLARWLKQKQVKRYTLSIATPLPGTPAYRPVPARELRYYDFLHLVTPPRRMHRFTFYFLFWKLTLAARPWRGWIT